MTVLTYRPARHRTALASLAAATLVLGTAAPAAAADPPTYDLELPRGIACADFAVGLDFIGGKRNVRQFTDANGDVVGVLVTGAAEAVVLTNLTTGESVTAPSRGAATRITDTGEGTSTVVHTGNLLLILFPTDDPAGPSTTLIQGRTVFTVAPDPFPDSDLITVQSITGKTTDLCAALARDLP